MPGYRIAVGELHIPEHSHIAAHRVILFINDQNQVYRQINGLASSWNNQSGRWDRLYYGIFGKLRGYDTSIDAPGDPDF